MSTPESTTHESCLPSSFISPPSSLPPTPRDFEMHRLALVEFLSTRQIAEKNHISQTRVRQIIARVADWLTEMLPIKSEQDLEKEKRYAIHLAAAQLQHQIETLKNFFDATSDPKYFRQQTRAILALGRLGVPSHTLDSLAANVIPDDDSSEEFWPVSDRATSPTEGLPDPADAAPSASASSSSFSIHNSSFPPQEDCSPNNPQVSSLAPQASPAPSSNSSLANDLFFSPAAAKDTLKGLDIQEQRLLTLINQTLPDQTVRLQHLQESLSDLRQARANFILQLGPNSPVDGPTTALLPGSSLVTH